MKKTEVSQSLELILKKTIDVLEESKKDIFVIAESSRKEYRNIKSELSLVNEDINEVIDQVDRLERNNKKARIRLMEVSRDFNLHTESVIKQAYQEAEKSLVEVVVLSEKEEQLKKRRRELEERLINLKSNVERAENLVSKVGISKDYLTGELDNLSDCFDNLRQKQHLAIRVIQAQEEERKRLAREIHDGPAQSIANLVFRVELTQQLVDKDLKKAKEELEELKNLIRLSMQDVRKIIYDLRPMSLDDLGLIPTLRRYIDKYIKQNGIMVDFKVFGYERRLATTYEVTIFRLIQEGLNNIYKHARATSCEVRLEYAEERINLLILDNGLGFTPNKTKKNKFGLIGMQERCELLGGKIIIDSKLKKGTMIKIILPIEERGGVSNEENKGFSS